MLKWLKYSGVFITIAVNPFHWRIGAEWGKDELNGWTAKINLLFVGMHLVIDNGNW